MTAAGDKSSLWRVLILSYPGIILGVFFVIPIGIMIVTSFYHREGSFYEPGFELTHYARVFSPLYLKALWASFLFSALSSTIAVALAFPFVFFIAQYSRKIQTLALVLILCVLSLSEVIVAFSWSNLLSRSAGISNFFAWIGVMDKPASWSRGFGALLASLSYFNISFAVLMLYPHCTRLDPSYVEAARTMGAHPVRAFFEIVLAILKGPIIAAWIVLFVFSMGAVVTPQWLGKPEHWMLAVYISKEALERNNFPFAAALAVIFLIFTIICVLLIKRVNKDRR